MPLLDTLKQLPAKSKGAIAVSAVAILAITFLMLKIAGAPSYALLSSGMNPADTGKVTAVLDAQGIGYELQSNGTAISVDKASLAQARIAVAGAGVSMTGGQQGFELLDQQKLGTSDFQQKVTYQRALEGELGNMLSGVDGVTGAQVSLVLPEDQLFTDDATPATAAVMLDNSADTLEPGAIRGMAQLVASSVQGLKSDNVTITDGSGTLLWPQGDGTATGGVGGATKQATEARYEQSLEANLNALLTRTLGPGKAQVQIKADLNVDKTSRNSLTYAKKGVPLQQTVDNETLRGSGTRPGGAAGTASNVQTYSAGTTGASNSNYRHKVDSTEYGVDKTVTKTEVAPGGVNKLQVALLVDKSVPAATFRQIQGVVSSAAGIDATRGDQLQAAQVAFAKPAAAPKAGPIPVSVLGYAKYVGLGIASLLFLFFMWRSMRKREGETLAEPAWLKQIERPTPLSELEAGQPTQMLPLPDRQPDFQLQTLDQLTEREPDRVARQVKAWMAED